MNIIRYFHTTLDRIASFLVGESKHSTTVPDHSQSISPEVPVAKSPMSLEDSHPTENPFESAPAMEQVLPPSTATKTAQKAAQTAENKKKISPEPTNGFRTKNTIKARPIDSAAQGNLAGMKTRKSGEKVSDDKIVQNETNDTVYSQRNEVVKIVYDRYAKFGDTIASAILSKTFLPNGLQLMLSRLEIESVGSPLPDHDQVVDWIDEYGTDEFCKRMKIRT